MYSSGNIDVRNWVTLFESLYIMCYLFGFLFLNVIYTCITWSYELKANMQILFDVMTNVTGTVPILKYRLLTVCHEQRSRATQGSRPCGLWTGGHPDLIHNSLPTGVAPSFWDRHFSLGHRPIKTYSLITGSTSGFPSPRLLVQFQFCFTINSCTPSAESQYEREQRAEIYEIRAQSVPEQHPRYVLTGTTPDTIGERLGFGGGVEGGQTDIQTD